MAVVLMVGAVPLAAQAVEPRMPVKGTVVGGRMHFQVNTTSIDSPDEPASEAFVRRGRIWVATELNEWIDAAVQVDVAYGEVAGRYAFIRFALNDKTRLSVGQFKRAFDLFQITSSSQILVIERAGNIRGVSPCAGVGGVCSYSRFAEKLEFTSLDIGALLEGSNQDGSLSYLLSVTNGAGGNAREENNAKSASARAVWQPMDRLKLGGNVGVHDFPNPITGQDEHAPAAAFDAEWGDFDGGLHVQAGVMGGRNWRNLDASGVGTRFLTYQTIATYRHQLPSAGRITAIEPVARVSWGDPDRSTARDGGFLYTPGLVLHFDGRNKIAANIDAWRPGTGTTVWGMKFQTYVYF